MFIEIPIIREPIIPIVVVLIIIIIIAKGYNYTSFEYHAFVFSSPLILCMTIYRPAKHHPCFISEFYELLSILHSIYNRVLLTGDFNIHTDDISDPL